MTRAYRHPTRTTCHPTQTRLTADPTPHLEAQRQPSHPNPNPIPNPDPILQEVRQVFRLAKIRVYRLLIPRYVLILTGL